MTKREGPTVIRKYANRRLYNTGTSTYVTLDDLAAMVRAGEDFVAVDARNDADITHQVLTQIIVDLEGRDHTLMTPAFLRTLIRCYGSGLEAVVPAFLEQSLAALPRGGDGLDDAFVTRDGEADADARVRRNVEAFERALRTAVGAPAEPAERRSGEFDVLKTQLEAMQRRLDQLVSDRS